MICFAPTNTLFGFGIQTFSNTIWMKARPATAGLTAHFPQEIFPRLYCVSQFDQKMEARKPSEDLKLKRSTGDNISTSKDKCFALT